MVDINLLPSDARAVEKKTKLTKVLTIAGIASVVFFTLITGIFLVLFLTTKQAASTALKSSVELGKQVDAAQSTVTTAVTLVAKYSELQKLLKTGPRYSILLQSLSDKVPADVNIKELTVTSPTKVNIAGDSPSYLSLSQFLQVLTSDQSSIFSGETLQSVTLDSQTGRVQFVMLVTLKDQSLIK